jgi:pSer/pThr/pTyr-binding forkhead associated (FHA) protein
LSLTALFAQLTITEVGRADRSITLSDTATIGRDSGNDIVLDSITVSRCHALLIHDAAQLLPLDLESSNRTLVNGRAARPDEPVRLDDRDVIRFSQVMVRYRALNLPYEEIKDEANDDPETDDRSATPGRSPD